MYLLAFKTFSKNYRFSKYIAIFLKARNFSTHLSGSEYEMMMSWQIATTFSYRCSVKPSPSAGPKNFSRIAVTCKI